MRVGIFTEDSLFRFFQDLTKIDLFVFGTLQFRAQIFVGVQREFFVALFILNVSFEILNFFALQGEILFVFSNASIGFDQITFQLISIIFGQFQLSLQFEVLVNLQLFLLSDLLEITLKSLHFAITGHSGVFELDVEFLQFVLQRIDHLSVLFTVQSGVTTDLVEFHLQSKEIIFGDREFLGQSIAFRLSNGQKLGTENPSQRCSKTRDRKRTFCFSFSASINA